jgi:hypothetical protein
MSTSTILPSIFAVVSVWSGEAGIYFKKKRSR